MYAIGFFITAIDSHVQSRVLVARVPRLSCLNDLRMVHWWYSSDPAFHVGVSPDAKKWNNLIF